MYLKWALANREQATALTRDNTQDDAQDPPTERRKTSGNGAENNTEDKAVKEKPPSPTHPWDEEEKAKGAPAGQ